MPVYTFYLHDEVDSISAFEIAQFDDAGLAVAYGERLLRERPRYRFVEIASGEESVCQVFRNDAPEVQALAG